MAWLIAHAGRPQPRLRLAALLWPEKDPAEARRNLRVVINDLAGCLAALDLAACLEIERDWLCLRPTGYFIHDEEILGAPADMPLAAALTGQLALPWLPDSGAVLEGEIAEWLEERRQRFEEWAARRLAVTSPAQTLPGSDGTSPVRHAPEARSGQWRRLALIHLIPPIAQVGDEKRRLTEARALCRTLADGAVALGAHVMAVQNTLTLAVGLQYESSATRWSAWRIALALREAAPAARIGIGCGRCWVGDGDIAGESLERVRRQALTAEAGEIVAGAEFAAFAALGGRLEERRFRDLPDTETIWRFPLAAGCCPRPMSAQAPASVFVGREEELAALAALFDRGAAGACITAPPGMGKTRLAEEFLRAHPERPAHWLGCRAELAAQPWGALYEFLSRPELRAIVETSPHALALRQFLANRHVSFEIRGEMIGLLAQTLTGGLVVVDDAHWLDEPCARLFDELRSRIRAFWLLTRRPVESGWLPDLDWIELRPLDDSAARALLDAVSPGPTADSERRTAVLRCRGNPLLLIAEGAKESVEVEEGLTRQMTLPPDGTRILGLAALLGQHFRRSELVAIMPEADVDAALDTAAKQGMILLWNADQMNFAHPLLRERCLERLDIEMTAHLAGRAATWLAENRDYVRAAELFEIAGDVEKARHAWLAIAQAAIAEEDAIAACSHFARVERLGFSPGAAGEWERIHYVRALIVRDGYGIEAIHRLLADQASRPAVAGDANGAERHFAANALIYLWSGGLSHTAGLEHARRLSVLAITPVQQYIALWAQANTTLLTGGFRAAREMFGRLREIDLPFVERTRYFPSDPQPFIHTNFAWAGWYLGEPDWRAEYDAAIEAGRQTGMKQDECIAHTYAGAICLCAGDWEGLARHAAIGFEIAHREAFTFWELFAGLLMQIAAARAGARPDPQACARAEEAIRIAYPAGLNTVRWLIAEAHAACGDWAATRALCATAVREGQASEHLYSMPDLWRLLGEALAHEGIEEAAWAALDQACTLRKIQGARGWLDRWAHLGHASKLKAGRARAWALQEVIGFAPARSTEDWAT